MRVCDKDVLKSESALPDRIRSTKERCGLDEILRSSVEIALDYVGYYDMK